MLKTASAVGLAGFIEVGNKEENNKGIQVYWNEKEPIPESKKWIQAEKTKASKAKNLNS